MTLTWIVLLAIGLAMDCFAISLSCGTFSAVENKQKGVLMAFCFALFQGIMPLIGWGIGFPFAKTIEKFDHWFAFAILLFLGAKMIYETLKNRDKNAQTDFFTLKSILLLSLATSIDALVSGLVFITYPKQIIKAVIIIALTTFLFSLLGLKLGKFFKQKFSHKVEILGGIILIAIGTKILIEHLYFHT